MRLLPRSLFGRLVLTFVSGVILTMLVTMTVQWPEREAFAFRVSAVRAAQRMADLVRLMERLPPDARGQVIGVVWKCFTSSPTFSMSKARSSSRALCSEAHAPTCEPTGRLRKYAIDSDAGIRSTRPTTRTWRSSSAQWKASAACGFASSSRAFRER